MLPILLKLCDFLDGKIEGVPFVVDELLPIGGLSLLGGHPKAGKSTLIRNLIRSVARGGDFLGRQTLQSTVLYYALEELPFHIANEFAALGCRDEDVYLRAGPIDKAQILRVLDNDVTSIYPRLVVIDPLFDSLNVQDINSYTQINTAMKELLAVARYRDCHILVVHHTNKSDNRGGNSILGSQALAGSTDCNIFLTVDSQGRRIIETQQRSGVVFDRTILEFVPDTHELVVATTVKQSRALALRKILLEALGDKILSTTEWSKLVRGRTEDKLAEIKALDILGFVTSRIEGRNTLWQKNNGMPTS